MADALAYAHGRGAEALALAARLRRVLPAWSGSVAYIYGRLGDTAEARRIVRAVQLRPRTGPLSNAIATACASLGDTGRALDELERATDARENWPSFISLSAPAFDPVRRSARFAAIVRRVRLDERIFTSPTGGRPR